MQDINPKIVSNNGNISFGSNSKNITNNYSNTPAGAIDWQALESEINELKNNDLKTVNNFADEALVFVKKRNTEGLVKCVKKLGTIGIEILTKSSATLLAEFAKKYFLL